MSDDRKDLPPVNAPNFLEKVRETLGVYLGNRGGGLDRGVTLRDLSEANIVMLSKGFLSGAGGKPSPIAGPGTALTGPYEPDLTPPPTPTGFSASTSKTSIQVVTDPQIYRQGHGHAKTRVFGAKYTGTPLTFADAVVLDEFSGDVHAFPVDPASEYRLWVTWVTQDGQESPPAGGTNGFTAVAGLLDDVNIAYLTASKIRAGSISVGEYIQSSGYVAGSAGWRINGDGTAEFSGVVVRGTVYATAGQIGGNTIDSTGLQSPGYTAGASGWRLDSSGNFYANAIALRGQITGGALTGYGWPAAGAGNGFYLGPSGLLLGNENDGQYFQVTAAGRIRAPGLDINAGVATFSGALLAASGTFSGNLSAAGGTFSGVLTAGALNAVNSINLAGDSITVPVFANASDTNTVSDPFTYATTILTAPAVNSMGGSTLISVSIETETDVSETLKFVIKRNGTELYYFNAGRGVTTTTANFAETYNGSAVYTIGAKQFTIGGTSATYGIRSMTVLGIKKLGA